MVKSLSVFILFTLLFKISVAQTSYLFKPDRVFDGVEMHQNWAVLVTGEHIEAVGPADKIKSAQQQKSWN